MKLSMEQLNQVAVIGAGEMGQQIAMVCALGGKQVYLQDINESALSKAERKLAGIMEDWVQKGKLTETEKNASFARLQMTTDMKTAVRTADLVIEAVVEKLEIKQAVFKQLDKLAPEQAILASNSSTIVNSKLAAVTTRPDKVINMHFFYPPLVMDCIEVVKSEQTSIETANQVMQFCQSINRTGILLEKEIFGFIANRILLAISKEAVQLYEGGYADFKDIDVIIKKALGHPLGPFELMDLSGLDVGYFVNQLHYAETGDPADKPAKSIVEKVEAGHLGRKTGKGWYEYSKNNGEEV